MHLFSYTQGNFTVHSFPVWWLMLAVISIFWLLTSTVAPSWPPLFTAALTLTISWSDEIGKCEKLYTNPTIMGYHWIPMLLGCYWGFASNTPDKGKKMQVNCSKKNIPQQVVIINIIYHYILIITLPYTTLSEGCATQFLAPLLRGFSQLETSIHRGYVQSLYIFPWWCS